MGANRYGRATREQTLDKRQSPESDPRFTFHLLDELIDDVTMIEDRRPCK